jgi:hypothetical protein
MEKEQKIVLKVNFGNECRRVALQIRPLTLCEIREFLSQAFPTLGQQYQLWYSDEEGDKILIETDTELLEALHSIDNQTFLIRLTVEARPTNTNFIISPQSYSHCLEMTNSLIPKPIKSTTSNYINTIPPFPDFSHPKVSQVRTNLVSSTSQERTKEEMKEAATSIPTMNLTSLIPPSISRHSFVIRIAEYLKTNIASLPSEVTLILSLTGMTNHILNLVNDISENKELIIPTVLFNFPLFQKGLEYIFEHGDKVEEKLDQLEEGYVILRQQDEMIPFPVAVRLLFALNGDGDKVAEMWRERQSDHHITSSNQFPFQVFPWGIGCGNVSSPSHCNANDFSSQHVSFGNQSSQPQQETWNDKLPTKCNQMSEFMTFKQNEKSEVQNKTKSSLQTNEENQPVEDLASAFDNHKTPTLSPSCSPFLDAVSHPRLISDVTRKAQEQQKSEEIRLRDILVGMGFDEGRVLFVLNGVGNNLETALETLLSQ